MCIRDSTSVAYFSMEFMLSEALPIYSGGLGNVAGDQMKAASDLGVPVVGVGLLYGQGYFRQDFDSEGRQQALYPVNDPGQLPIRPLRQPNGEWLRLQIQLPGSKIWLRCWEVSAVSYTHLLGKSPRLSILLLPHCPFLIVLSVPEICLIPCKLLPGNAVQSW